MADQPMANGLPPPAVTSAQPQQQASQLPPQNATAQPDAQHAASAAAAAAPPQPSATPQPAVTPPSGNFPKPHYRCNQFAISIVFQIFCWREYGLSARASTLSTGNVISTFALQPSGGTLATSNAQMQGTVQVAHVITGAQARRRHVTDFAGRPKLLQLWLTAVEVSCCHAVFERHNLTRRLHHHSGCIGR